MVGTTQCVIYSINTVLVLAIPDLLACSGYKMDPWGRSAPPPPPHNRRSWGSTLCKPKLDVNISYSKQVIIVDLNVTLEPETTLIHNDLIWLPALPDRTADGWSCKSRTGLPSPSNRNLVSFMAVTSIVSPYKKMWCKKSGVDGSHEASRRFEPLTEELWLPLWRLQGDAVD